MSPARPDGRGPVLRAAAWAVAALLLCAGTPLRAQEEHTHSHDEAGVSIEADNDPRVRDIAAQLTCYCGCNTQSIADCTCGVAQGERRTILEQLEEGQTAEQIVAGWVERHGPRILIEPPPEGFNLLGWLLPGVALAVAALFLVWRMRSWTGAPAHAATTATDQPSAPPDSTYAKKLREELERRRS